MGKTREISDYANKQTTKNVIINGNFDIWQRGISSGAPTTVDRYQSDRWKNTATLSSFVTTQESFTLGQTEVPNSPSFYHRVLVASVSDPTSRVLLEQRIEGVNKFSNEKITLSFWAKADTPKNIATEFEQNFGTGGSPSPTVDTIAVTTHALTTTWQQFIVTFNIPDLTGKTIGTDLNNSYIGLNFWFDAGSNFNSRTNTLGQQSGTFDIAQVQVERGGVASDFELRGIGEELSLCQRYYEVGASIESAFGTAGLTNELWHPYKVSKRVAASISGNFIAGGSSNVGSNLPASNVVDGFNTFWSPVIPSSDAAPYINPWIADAEL